MNSQSQPMPGWAKLVLAASLALSVALGLLAFREPSHQAIPPRITTNFITTPPQFVVQEITATVFVTNGFHWSRVQSTNYAEYVTNLRRVGCPQRTIDDIISAELRPLYEARGRALQRSDHSALQREYWDQLRQLGVAPQALFGPSASHLDMIALIQFFAGPLSSEEKFDQILLAAARADAEENSPPAPGVGDTNTPAARRAVELFAAELGRILSPIEFQEISARLATFGLLRGGPAAEVAGLTPHELKQLAMLQTQGDAKLSFFESIFNFNSASEFAARLTNNVEAVLGPERARRFWLASDREFQTIHSFTKREKLPVETAVQLHELRAEIAAELKRTREELGGAEAARAQRELEVEAEAQSAARQILGSNGYEKFLGRGGYWLTNGSSL